VSWEQLPPSESSRPRLSALPFLQGRATKSRTQDHGAHLLRFTDMRSVWKGSINFGLVNIPVAVYPATREEKLAFKQLRKKDQSPIRYKKVAEADDKEVPAAEIVKGYE
jgi:hypothetical protein